MNNKILAVFFTLVVGMAGLIVSQLKTSSLGKMIHLSYDFSDNILHIKFVQIALIALIILFILRVIFISRLKINKTK